MKLKRLFLSFALICLLCLSFAIPQTFHLWEILDAKIFHFLNTYLLSLKPLQYLWGAMNHKLMDWVEDLIFIAFFVLSVKKAPLELKRKQAAQFIFSILLGAFVIFCVNKQLFRRYTLFPRKSPSLVTLNCTRASQQITAFHFKDSSGASFPGDHATTLILFGILYATFADKKLARFAWGYAIFRILPRMIVGAHWFSDIMVGSTSIALLVTSVFLHTPAHIYFINLIEKLMYKEYEPETFISDNTVS